MTNNTTDRTDMIESNMPLVTFCVLKVNNNIYDDDLFQEGCIGLIQAVDKYDSNRGVAFSTYATNCINGYIINYKNRNALIRPMRDKGGYMQHPICDLNESVASRTDLIQNIVDDIFFNEFLSSLSEREKKIVELRLDGMLQDEIHHIMGLSQPQISKILTKIQKQYTKIYNTDKT